MAWRVILSWASNQYHRSFLFLLPYPQGRRQQAKRSLAWNGTTEEEREPYAMQMGEEKRLHLEIESPGCVYYAPVCTSSMRQANAKSTTSGLTRLTMMTCIPPCPSRVVVVAPWHLLLLQLQDKAATRPGAKAVHAARYQWQKSPSLLRLLLDSSFNSSSPAWSLFPLRPHMAINSCFLHPPKFTVWPSSFKFQISDCSGPLQPNFSYPSPPVSPTGPSTGGTTGSLLVIGRGTGTRTGF